MGDIGLGTIIGGIVGAFLTGGVALKVLDRLFAKRDIAATGPAEYFKAQFEIIQRDREQMSKDLESYRSEVRDLNTKLDRQAAEFYELKGRYEAGQDQIARGDKRYFDLLQSYSRLMLQVEVLQHILEKNGIEVPHISDFLKRRATDIPTEQEVSP